MAPDLQPVPLLHHPSARLPRGCLQDCVPPRLIYQEKPHIVKVKLLKEPVHSGLKKGGKVQDGNRCPGDFCRQTKLDLTTLKFFPSLPLSPESFFQSRTQPTICALKFGNRVLGTSLHQIENPPGTMLFQVGGQGPEIPLVQNL
jgi:hypothetical protein